MKKVISLFYVLTIIATYAHAQKSNDEQDAQKHNNRVSFIVGPGASYVTRRLYDNPVINQTDNTVALQYAGRLKTNLALGIAYTPYTYEYTHTVSYVDTNKNVTTREQIESVPAGITYAIFINPVAFSKATESQSFFNMLDFGVGAGYRGAGGFLIMGTVEFFAVSQPRDWFITQYKGQNLPYLIDGAPQRSIDLSDKNIFVAKPVITLGFKVCYTFEIVKHFTSAATKVSN